MSNKVVIDDSNVTVGNQTAVSPIVYEPTQSWRLNVMCDDCNVNGEAALGRLRDTVYSDTWTLAWWEPERPLLSINLNFNGTSVAAYFVLLFRSLDPNSTGSSTLTFLIDNTVRRTQRVTPGDFTFGPDDFTPRTMLFQAADLEPKPHSLSIQWTHGGRGPRPPVSVALDSIEFTPFDVSIATSRSGSNTKLIASIVVPIVVVLALIFGVFLWWRRRRAGKRRQAQEMIDLDAGPEAIPSGSRGNRSIQPFLANGSEQPSGPLKGRQVVHDTHGPPEAGHPPSYQEALTFPNDMSSGGPSQSTSSQTTWTR